MGWLCCRATIVVLIPSRVDLDHGYYVLTQNALMHYKVDNRYKKTNEYGLFWKDDTINIKWPCKKPILNKKDKNFKLLKNFVTSDFPKKK